MSAVLRFAHETRREQFERNRWAGRPSRGLAGTWVTDRIALGCCIQLCERQCFPIHRLEMARAGYQPAGRPPFDAHGRCIAQCEDCREPMTNCVQLLPPGQF